MTRMPRRQSEADIYHVFLRGSSRQLIFEDDHDRRVFLHALALAIQEANASLYAYCLMGNHYHLIVRSSYDKLPDFAYKLNRTYATYFNARHNRKGHLFEERFKSQPINDDSYFLEAIRYVHRNPVEARISATCEYSWSSYSEYLATGKNLQDVFPIDTVLLAGHTEYQQLILPKISDTARVLDMLGGPESFSEFHSLPCKQKLTDDRPASSAMTQTDILDTARTILEGFEPALLKTLPKPDRDRELRRLKMSTLTQAQISLVTGISLSTVNRA